MTLYPHSKRVSVCVINGCIFTIIHVREGEQIED